MSASLHPAPVFDDPSGTAELDALTEPVVALVRRWLDVSAGLPVDAAAQRLAGVLDDPDGLRFTVGFVDGVIRPEDTRVAARTFAELARDVPAFLPWHLKAAMKLGARAGLVAPQLVIPVVRRALRHMVGHLVVDARDTRLAKALRRIFRSGTRVNLNLLGEAVLGRAEAERRLAGIRRLLARDDVDYVSVKVSAAVAPHNPWAFDEAVAHVVESLRPLYRDAVRSSTPKFINLDMEEYRDLDLTVAVFTRLLDEPEFLGLEAGIVLQAYLPDSVASMITLQDWAAARRARGGAAIKVRIVKGANLPMERVEADVHDWPLATWHSKQDSDTNYKRVLDYALRPERVANVRIGVAGHNLFDIAFAWLLAGERGARDGIEFEMLLGMAQGQAEAVRRDVGGLLLYTPVVHPQEFDVAIAYLVRRLEEGASRENFMSAVFHLHDDTELFARERDRFVASLGALDRTVPASHRVQDRHLAVADTVMSGFRNVADTDPAVRANADWGREILGRVPTSRLGEDLVAAATVTTTAELDARLATAVSAAAGWGARTGAERAGVLRRAAVELERRRADLVEVMAAECGKTVEQSDPEVSEAIDFANFYANLAEGLDHVDGAVARPVSLTVVTPPWNFPVAIPAGSTLAALAAGSAVVIKPATQARRCGAIMVDALLAAGVPVDVLQPVHVDEGELGRALVADPRVDRLILTGGFETAELFRSFRPDLQLLAETSGKNAIVVTPSADLDLAVKDVVRSAFGHAGQKCSAASLVILVGSVARSDRFRRQLVDAVRSLHVAHPHDPSAQLGPLVEAPTGKLQHALTTLEPGERWLVEPRRLDDTLWTPGVKDGVEPNSPFHLTEYFGPVLGIMTATSLSHAIELQNAVAYGLTAGLFALDADEIATWLDTVEAGNLYVNRGTTGAIVRRQPFGGWKRSAVGAGTKAGGPNYLVGLSDWTSAPASADATLGDSAPLLAAAKAAGLGDPADLDGLERALHSDAAAWRDEFGAVRDVSGLVSERNVLRYRPHPVTIRLADDSVVALVRVAAAGVVAGANVDVSAATPLPAPVADALRVAGVRISVEDDPTWTTRLRSLSGARVRLIGADRTTTVDGRADVAVYAQPVTEAGRVELLPFLREQAISITAHRFGTPDPIAHEVLPEGPGTTGRRPR